jgi:hypothetical protein
MSVAVAGPGLGWRPFATTHDERNDRLVKRSCLPTRTALVVLATLLALPLAPTALPVEAKKQSRTATRTFDNAAPIRLPFGLSEPHPATLYPSPIKVKGLKGKVLDVNLRLNDLTHAFPSDIEMLLVGPNGQTAIVMAGVGGNSGVEDATLRLDDEATEPLPVAAPLQSGTFRPTNASGGAIAFLDPAPQASANTALSVFDGTNANGRWLLFVQDQFQADTGVFDDGWELEITTKAKARKKR